MRFMRPHMRVYAVTYTGLWGYVQLYETFNFVLLLLLCLIHIGLWFCYYIDKLLCIDYS